MKSLKKGNSEIIKALPKGSRAISATLFHPIIKDGVKLCAWCGEVEAVNKYCSIECQNSCYAHCSPQSNMGIAYLFDKNGSFCKLCGIDWSEDILNAHKMVLDDAKNYLSSLKKHASVLSPSLIKKYSDQTIENIRILESGGV